MTTLDPIEIGRKVKSTYSTGVAKDGRSYSQIPDAEIGSMFLLKHGEDGIKALGMSIPTEDEIKAKKAKENVLANATNLRDVVAKGQRGELSGKEYEDALNFAASEYNKQAFEEGGKQLTGSERAILSGTMINIQDYKGSILDAAKQKITGYAPAVKSRVVDSPETMINKLDRAIAGLRGEPVPEAMVEPNQMDKYKREGSLVGNIANDVKEMYEGVKAIPDVVKTFKENPKETTKAVVGAVGKEMANSTGFYQDDKTGRIIWDPQVAINHAYNNPLDTALAVIPAVKGAKTAVTASKANTALKATMPAIENVDDVGRASNVASKVSKGIENTTELITGGGPKEFIAKNVNLDDAKDMSAVLLEKNVFSSPTTKGKIVATQKALTDEGKAISDVLTKSPKIINSRDLEGMVTKHLTETFGEGNDIVIRKIVSKMSQKGQFDVASNTHTLDMKTLNDIKVDLMDYGPKALNIPETGPLTKDMAIESARVIREYIAKEVPEATPHLRNYGALRTYMDDVLSDPQGVKLNDVGSVVKFLSSTGQNAVTYPLQKGYNAMQNLMPDIPSSGTSMVRDMRSKQGNPVFKPLDSVKKKPLKK